MNLPTIRVRVTVDGVSRVISVVARDKKAAIDKVQKLAEKVNPNWSSIECEVIGQCMNYLP